MKDWKKLRPLIGHVVFWTCLFLLYLYVNNARFSLQMAMIQSVILLIVIIPLTYFNIAYLIPRFFEQKNKGLYIVYLIGLIIVGATLIIIFEEVNLFDAYSNERPPDFVIVNKNMPNDSFMRDSLRQDIFIPFDSVAHGRFRMPPDSLDPGRRRGHFEAFRGRPFGGFFNFRFSIMRWFIQLFQTAFIILFSTVYRISQIMTKKQKEALILESQNLSSELKFLKSQINPHFLFNALNNIYTLSIIKSDKTSDVVMRLSEMLKYIIYETETKDFVPLQKEISYIENFIAIFKLKDSRISENVTFNYDVPEDLYIAPMILIPFIENAFKHSKIEDVKNSWIKIDLSYKDFQLVFTVENSTPTTHFEKDKVGGIGIANVKRRLELIYPHKYELSIHEKNHVHSVLMKIIMDNEN